MTTASHPTPARCHGRRRCADRAARRRAAAAHRLRAHQWSAQRQSSVAAPRSRRRFRRGTAVSAGRRRALDRLARHRAQSQAAHEGLSRGARTADADRRRSKQRDVLRQSRSNEIGGRGRMRRVARMARGRRRRSRRRRRLRRRVGMGIQTVSQRARGRSPAQSDRRQQRRAANRAAARRRALRACRSCSTTSSGWRTTVIAFI